MHAYRNLLTSVKRVHLPVSQTACTLTDYVRQAGRVPVGKAEDNSQRNNAVLGQARKSGVYLYVPKTHQIGENELEAGCDTMQPR